MNKGKFLYDEMILGSNRSICTYLMNPLSRYSKNEAILICRSLVDSFINKGEDNVENSVCYEVILWSLPILGYSILLTDDLASRALECYLKIIDKVLKYGDSDKQNYIIEIVLYHISLVFSSVLSDEKIKVFVSSIHSKLCSFSSSWSILNHFLLGGCIKTKNRQSLHSVMSQLSVKNLFGDSFNNDFSQYEPKLALLLSDNEFVKHLINGFSSYIRLFIENGINVLSQYGTFVFFHHYISKNLPIGLKHECFIEINQIMLENSSKNCSKSLVSRMIPISDIDRIFFSWFSLDDFLKLRIKPFFDLIANGDCINIRFEIAAESIIKKVFEEGPDIFGDIYWNFPINIYNYIMRFPKNIRKYANFYLQYFERLIEKTYSDSRVSAIAPILFALIDIDDENEILRNKIIELTMRFTSSLFLDQKTLSTDLRNFCISCLYHYSFLLENRSFWVFVQQCQNSSFFIHLQSDLLLMIAIISVLQPKLYPGAILSDAIWDSLDRNKTDSQIDFKRMLIALYTMAIGTDIFQKSKYNIDKINYLIGSPNNDRSYNLYYDALLTALSCGSYFTNHKYSSKLKTYHFFSSNRVISLIGENMIVIRHGFGSTEATIFQQSNIEEETFEFPPVDCEISDIEEKKIVSFDNDIELLDNSFSHINGFKPNENTFQPQQHCVALSLLQSFGFISSSTRSSVQYTSVNIDSFLEGLDSISSSPIFDIGILQIVSSDAQTLQSLETSILKDFLSDMKSVITPICGFQFIAPYTFSNDPFAQIESLKQSGMILILNETRNTILKASQIIKSFDLVIQITPLEDNIYLVELISSTLGILLPFMSHNNSWIIHKNKIATFISICACQFYSVPKDNIIGRGPDAFVSQFAKRNEIIREISKNIPSVSIFEALRN